MNLANTKRPKKPGWRRPKQRRARQTVEAVLDAVARVLKRDGLKAVTTNRIAEVAGVSIGSVYQYFPDKQAIFVALHRRHIDEIDRLVATKLVENANSPLEDLIRSMVEAITDAHTTDPELYEMMFSEVPHRAEGTKDFTVRFHGAFRLAIAARAGELGIGRDLDKLVFVVTHMVESLSHGAALRRPPGLSLADAKEEAVRAIMAYLQSCAHF
ncbi:MAG TPA: TetR/AcrR family transcriptional regulator [Chthoniobacterales bacterium]|jgi:AcrR family transcriptional regulator|nr:TetR/AcrR family transcriptional regulator [Chthoniobacterales bacterium]